MPRMLERFHKARNDTNRNRPTRAVPEVDYELMGTWAIGEAYTDFMNAYLEAMAQKKAVLG